MTTDPGIRRFIEKLPKREQAEWERRVAATTAMNNASPAAVYVYMVRNDDLDDNRPSRWHVALLPPTRGPWRNFLLRKSVERSATLCGRTSRAQTTKRDPGEWWASSVLPLHDRSRAAPLCLGCRRRLDALLDQADAQAREEGRDVVP